MNSSHHRDIVLFDGVCHLCAWSVQFILTHESQATLRFASVQSEVGARLLRQHGMNPDAVDTFVLIRGEKMFTRSDAALQVAQFLRKPWSGLQYLRLIPRPIRDGLYNWVARNRYRIFGRSQTCMMPTEGTQHRFLSD